jgi:hypothetical protein
MRSINVVSVCLLTASMIGCGLSSSLIPTVDNVPGDNDAAGDASDDVIHIFTNDAPDDASDSMAPPCDDANHYVDDAPVVMVDSSPDVSCDDAHTDVDKDAGHPVKDSGVPPVSDGSTRHDSSTYHDSGSQKDASTPDASEVCHTECERTCGSCKVKCVEVTSCDHDKEVCYYVCDNDDVVCHTTCDDDEENCHNN